MNVQRISAIFEKDSKDFIKNITLLMMPFISIVLALLYDRIGDSEAQMPMLMIYIIVGVTFSTVTSVTIMTMMAEENEKKTLRGLILSPATFVDIIVGKSLVTSIITFITLVVSLLIIGIDPILDIRPIISLVLLFLFFLMLGIGIGLFAKSMASTSAYGMPVMFLFGFTPMFSIIGLSEDNIIMKILELFPIMQAIEIHNTSSWLPLGVSSIWVVAAAIFMYVCFRKTVTDE
ncbi:ABC transporter permease [Gracilibacillus caseinilyticus]|uniref:ABC transporter permease n=1 Tax=Gracilibacillus caseinilyticus TaxID=2932256 RepID=A0ABY4EWA5_9BACI|nr:ABC transporter permease [Gracilibacillus caseinilyticus]UOQ48696.1 ABC transporter permease [Gracilibacillus caseinilyticus]